MCISFVLALSGISPNSSYSCLYRTFKPWACREVALLKSILKSPPHNYYVHNTFIAGANPTNIIKNIHKTFPNYHNHMMYHVAVTHTSKHTHTHTRACTHTLKSNTQTWYTPTTAITRSNIYINHFTDIRLTTTSTWYGEDMIIFYMITLL